MGFRVMNHDFHCITSVNWYLYAGAAQLPH